MTTPTPRPCPICRKPRTEKFTPFCSGRCRDRDLAQWFSDGYALPGPPATAEDFADRAADTEDRSHGGTRDD